MTKIRRNVGGLDLLSAAANAGVALSTGWTIFDRIRQTGGKAAPNVALYDRRDEDGDGMPDVTANPMTGQINIPADISARLGDDHINEILSTPNVLISLSLLSDKAIDDGDYWGVQDYKTLFNLLVTAVSREELDEFNSWIRPQVAANPSFTVHAEYPSGREEIEVKALTERGAFKKGTRQLKRHVKPEVKYWVERNPVEGVEQDVLDHAVFMLGAGHVSALLQSHDPHYMISVAEATATAEGRTHTANHYAVLLRALAAGQLNVGRDLSAFIVENPKNGKRRHGLPMAVLINGVPPIDGRFGISGVNSRIGKLGKARASAEARLRTGDSRALAELNRINAQIADEQKRRSKGERNPKLIGRLGYLDLIGSLHGQNVYLYMSADGQRGATFYPQADGSYLARHALTDNYAAPHGGEITEGLALIAADLPLTSQNGRGKLSPSVKSKLSSLAKMFHGGKNPHAGEIGNHPQSSHAKAKYYTRNGRLPWIKVLTDATGRHTDPSHVCRECGIQFDAERSFVGMTTGKRLQILGEGVHEVGQRLRANLIQQYPELAGYDVIRVSPVDVLWYETEEKHAGTDAPPLVHYYHNHGEDTGRIEDKPWLCVDREGMLFLEGGNYTVTELGIEN